MTDVESIVSAFAKGLMQAMLEADNSSCRVDRGTRRVRKKTAPLLVEESGEMAPSFPHMSDPLLDEAYQMHVEKMALREDPIDPEMSLEQVFMASKLAHESREPRTQPGPGEDEAQSWLGVN